MLRRTSLVSAAVAMLAAIAHPGPASAQSSGPNIVVIVGDDYGWPYYNFMWQHLSSTLDGFHPGGITTGCPEGSGPDDPCQMHVATPNLDRLAREGIVFGHGYATEAACQPAHESLYTGLHQRDLGLAASVGCVEHEGGFGAQTFPEAAKNAGYATFKAGRFYGPDGLAFTESTNEREVGERKSMAAVKDFIARQTKDQPWMVVWTPLTPHQEYAGIPSYIDGDYDDMEIKNPPHISSVYSESATHSYFEALTYFDDRIGELVEFLELLEARSCDLGPSYPATQGVPFDGIPTVYDALDPTNPLANGPVDDRRILKDVACQTTAGQPCPPPAACVQNTTNTCKPDPLFDPHNKPSSLPGTTTTTTKCIDTAAPPTNQYEGFRTNTVIIYIMDNGAAIQQSKGQFSENGLRTPIIVNHPRRIAPIGRHNPSLFPHPALVGSIDVMPSVLEYAGVAPRAFPDARSFVALVQDPWSNYPASWRRYFFSNAEPSATGMLAVTDSVPATFGSESIQLKIHANNNVLLPNSVKRVIDLTKDPFEELNPAKPPALMPPNGVYPGTSDPAVVHLQKVLNYWDNECMSLCQRCKAVSRLSDVACGGELDDSCGECTEASSLPCSYNGG